jgi:hypothetical protein
MAELIAISGKKRHGKNAVADIIADKLQQRGKTVAIRHWADSVKEECASMLAYHSRADVLKHLLQWSKSEQIALGVYADLFLLPQKPGRWAAMKWKLGIDKYRYYCPIDNVGKHPSEYHDAYQYILDCMYGKHGDEMKERFRTWMQWWGTEYKRDCVSINYWRDKLVCWVRDHGDLYDFVLIPDTRFPNEVECVKLLGGKVFRVNRPELVLFDDGLAQHSSETLLDGYGGFDCVIQNDWGLRQLELNVGKVLARLYPTR